MANFVTPDKTASRPFTPGGVYFGTVTRVDDSLNRVYVKIPRFVTNAEFGPLAVVGPELPVVDDRVACLFMENRADDIVVIGVVKNQSMLPTAPLVVATSTTHPDFPKVGTILYETDTEDIYVWTGTEWLTFFEVNLPATIYADLQGMAASATVALSVADNSVVLGDDTTGNYVSTIAAGTGVIVTGGSGEGSTPSIAIGQSVATTASPSFSTITSTVATGTAPLTVTSTTAVTNLNADLLDGQHGAVYAPSGMMAPFAGSSAPTGWLLCDGSAYSKNNSLYAALFATIGYTYGGSGEFFSVPDLRGRVPVALDNMGGTDANRLDVTNTLGGSGGVQTVTLDSTQIPSHVHGVGTLAIGTTGSTHTHKVGNYDGSGINNYVVDNTNYPIAQYQALVADGTAPNERITTSTTGSSHTHNITGSTDGLTGAGQSHDNMQPYILTNYIIKT